MKSNKKYYLLTMNLFRFFFSLIFVLLFLGCSANPPVPATVNPENGQIGNTPVDFNGTNIKVIIGQYVETGIYASVVVEPLSSSNTLDVTNSYTYTFSSNDTTATFPSPGIQYKYQVYFQGGNFVGNGWHTTAGPIQFNSIVAQSPRVNLTVEGKVVGSNTVIGPVVATAFDWYRGPIGGALVEDSANVDCSNCQKNGHSINDYVFAFPSNNLYATLPNPITSSDLKEIPGLQLKVFSNINGDAFSAPSNITVSLIGIGPYLGGCDTFLPCSGQFLQANGEPACDNYWNRNNSAGLFESGQKCLINGGQFDYHSNICLSDAACQQLHFSSSNLGRVVWRFRE